MIYLVAAWLLVGALVWGLCVWNDGSLPVVLFNRLLDSGFFQFELWSRRK